MSVKQIKAHIKGYATGKRSSWSAGQLDKAVMDMRKTAHLTAAEQRAAARETLADGVDGVNLDFTEVGEFLQSLPGHVKTAAKINQAQCQVVAMVSWNQGSLALRSGPL